jgi:tetratricopeptide (TPR) repeat protein
MLLSDAEPADAAVPLLDEALATFRHLRLPDVRNIAKCQLRLGRLRTDRGRLQEALEIVREQPRPLEHGEILEALGQHEQALAIYDREGMIRAASRVRQRIQQLS